MRQREKSLEVCGVPVCVSAQAGTHRQMIFVLMNLHKETVMVFGTFDLLHKGHVHFLSQAKQHGDKLVIALAPDNIVLGLKAHLPSNSFVIRLNNLKRLAMADSIVAGDGTLRNWGVIDLVSPDVIALGYDQTDLAKELKAFIALNQKPIRLVFIKPYVDHTLHSSTLISKVTS